MDRTGVVCVVSDSFCRFFILWTPVDAINVTRVDVERPLRGQPVASQFGACLRFEQPRGIQRERADGAKTSFHAVYTVVSSVLSLFGHPTGVIDFLQTEEKGDFHF